VLGFPRSGTTMLETMLDAHPDLASMDERAFLQDVIGEIRQLDLTYPEDLAATRPSRLPGAARSLLATRCVSARACPKASGSGRTRIH
jgi:hypothetical protein